MATLDDLIRQVAAQKDAIESVKTFIQGLRDQLAAAGNNPVKVQEVLDGMTSNTAALAAAIVTPGS